MSTTKELIEQIREDFLVDEVESGDNKRNALWKDSNIVRALNQSEREIARRCMLLQDSTTNSICFLNIVPDPITGLFPQTIQLSSKVIRVRFVLFPRCSQTQTTYPQNYDLVRTTTESLESESVNLWGFGRGWIGRRGRVERYLTDFQYRSLTFDRVPEYAGTVQIGVIRLPLNNLSAKMPDNEPEIKEYDLFLIHGALKYLYCKGFMTEDTETYDPIKEARWRNEFEKDINQISEDLKAMQPKEIICRPEGWDEGHHRGGFDHRDW
ncbi:MAG: hypothetical protein ABSG90_13770 [Dehalococcoidia bacterium]|jgi:hypothetical protein